MIELNEKTTNWELARGRREDLEALARSYGVDPESHPNKSSLVGAIMDAHREGPPADDMTPDMAEPVEAAAPRTHHDGRYRVLTQIKYMGRDGKAHYQLPHRMIAGDPAKGVKARKVDAFLRCPEQIGEEQVRDFFAKGCLEPAFE
jgi:hypothetical protein